MKPANEWTEDDVFTLPPGENDTFERKGARMLDLTIGGVNEGRVLDELSKQLSAFSNTGGGQIIYGITDQGAVDNGGIARSVKGNQSTKAWLEDVIPVLTEFEIIGCNVYEVRPKAAGSRIAADKSIYVVDIPDSDRTPHQAKRDLRYYVRLGGTSQPASHRLIEDIRNRRKHPTLDVTSLTIDNVWPQPFVNSDPPQFSGALRLRLLIRIKNKGNLMATSSCMQITCSVNVVWMNYDNRTVQPRGIDSFWELSGPLYPDMEIAFWIEGQMFASVPPPRAEAPWGGPWLIGGKPLSDVELSWRLFADHAPTKQDKVSLRDLGFADAAREAINRQQDGRRILGIYQNL